MTDDLTAIREAVAKTCAQFDDDYWAACDTDHRFPSEFYAEFGKPWQERRIRRASSGIWLCWPSERATPRKRNSEYGPMWGART